MGSGRSRFQRVAVGVIVGAVVLALALTLVSGVLAATAAGSDAGAAAGPGGAAEASGPTRSATVGPLPSPAPVDPALTENGDPKPRTKTPQGEATQVTDSEHIGGLIGFIGFMLGGILLLLRGRHRDRVARR